MTIKVNSENHIDQADMPSPQKKGLNISVWMAIITIFVVIVSLKAFIAYRSVQDLADSHTSITNTSNVIVVLKELHQAVLLAESGQRGYLITDDERYLEHYNEALMTLSLRIDAVRNLRTEIPGQSDRIRRLLDIVDEKIQELKETVQLTKENQERDALRIFMTGRGRNLYQEIADIFESIEADEFALQSSLYSAMRKSEAQNRMVFGLFAVSSLLMAILLMALMWFSLKRDEKYSHLLELKAEELEEKVKHRTQEITLYSEELARSNRELEDFAFVASHDLQEPLRKIQAFSNRVQSQYANELDEKGQDYIVRMNKAAKRMSLLIGDLLEFSRIKTRGKPFEETDLNEMVADVIEDLEIAIEESQAQVNVASMPTVKCDATQFHQLFMNLLSNAIKFRKDGNIPKIDIKHQFVIRGAEFLPREAGLLNETVAKKNWHLIEVMDNGIGFKNEYKEKIFAPFQRLHGRDEYKGTGIGLAICRRIVERHGGVLAAESIPDEGTTFVILLPKEPISAGSKLNETLQEKE